MHNEFLDLGGEKMSKSKGHVLTVDTLVERGIDPLAFRYFFLQAHYRQQQAFTWEAMDAAATALRRLVGHAVAAREAGGEPDAAAVEPHRRRFWAALADDLNAAAGAGRGRGRRCAIPACRRPTGGPSWPTSTGPSASAWPRPRPPTPTRAAPTRASTRLVAERAGGPGGQGLRHLRSHPRRAGRRGDRPGRHPHGPHLAPPVAAAPWICVRWRPDADSEWTQNQG